MAHAWGEDFARAVIPRDARRVAFDGTVEVCERIPGQTVQIAMQPSHFQTDEAAGSNVVEDLRSRAASRRIERELDERTTVNQSGQTA